MRRLISTAAVLACAAVGAAGCGGDDAGGDPLESALSYLPADTPFAVEIDTDVEGDQYQALDRAVDRFPFGDSIKQMLRRQLELGQGNVDFDDDVKPLLGNPFVVGATDVTSFVDDAEDDDFVAAIQAADGDALDRVIEDTDPEEQGEVAGATVYEDQDGTPFAVEGDMVVFAGSRELLDSALERADGDDHLDPEAFEQSLDGLPDAALARIYFDLQALIARDPDTEQARQVDWIAALRTLGMTARVEEDSVRIDFRARTEGDLTEEDLPLAAGDEAPGVVREEGEIGFGLRDPSQVVAFFESALQTLAPRDFGEYETGKRAIEQRYDVNLDDDVFAQLSGDVSVSVAVDGTFGVRAEVDDPDAFARTVDRVAEAIPDLVTGVTGVTRRGALHEARLREGGRFLFGVVDGVLVVAPNAARARSLAAAEPTEVPDASGSLLMAANAERVAREVLDQLGPQLGLGGIFGAGLLAEPLGDLSGSVSSSTDGMTGRIELTLD